MKLPKIALTVAAVLLGQATYGAETINIGFNTPLTGFAAADGKSALTGAELALEQINAAGGVNGRQLKLVVYDDQASPKESVPIANKLIEQDKVAIGISGSYSGATRAAAGVFQSAGVPYIAAYAVHPEITRSGEFVFRTSFVGEVQGRAGAKLIGHALGKKEPDSKDEKTRKPGECTLDVHGRPPRPASGAGGFPTRSS